MTLPDGYSEIAPGKLASVVTCLEMDAVPPQRPARADPAWNLRRMLNADLAAYRSLFERVGREWLWFSRLTMPAEELRRILADPQDEVWIFSLRGSDEGLLELDFRERGQCELAFFGLTAAARGGGAGRWLMNQAIERAWARPIRRLWVHTCTFDHPAALDFYRRSGFRAYARRVEVEDDPRLVGLLPRDAAPGIPIVERSPR